MTDLAPLDPLALAQAATSVAGDRPVLEVALELAGAARTLTELLDRLGDCARFAATIEAADLETSSTRLLVTVRTHADADPEQLRTDRTDGAWGQVVADRVRRHLGRRVLIHKQLEDAGDSKKVRVLVWLDPLDGAAPSMPSASAADGAPPDDPDDPVERAYRRAANERQPQTDGTRPMPPASPEPGAGRDQLVARILGTVDDATIPRPHLEALLAARFDGATSLDDLTDQQLDWLARRTRTTAGVDTLRSAAASDFAAAHQPHCSQCGAPSDQLDTDGQCPSCAVPF